MNEKPFTRFRGKNAVFKFIEIVVNGALDWFCNHHIIIFVYFYSALSSSEDVFQFVIDRRVDGALVDVHGLKHHIKSLSQHNIQVNALSFIFWLTCHYRTYFECFLLQSEMSLPLKHGYPPP